MGHLKPQSYDELEAKVEKQVAKVHMNQAVGDVAPHLTNRLVPDKEDTYLRGITE